MVESDLEWGGMEVLGILPNPQYGPCPVVLNKKFYYLSQYMYTFYMQKVYFNFIVVDKFKKMLQDE